MSQSTQEALKRAFAQAPAAGADDAFVAAVAAQVADRRRLQRIGRRALVAMLVVAAVGLAWLLAQLALTTFVSSLGVALLGLPEQLGSAALAAGHAPLARYAGVALLLIALPLAATAWLVRRI